MNTTPLSWDQYATQWAGLHGGVDPRRVGGAMAGWLRVSYALGRALVRLRIGPAVVTAAGLLLSLLVPAFVNQGGWWVPAAGALVVASALADSVDGAVAVVGRRVSRLGFVYDSLCDRLAEVAWLAGLKLLGVPGWLVVTCLAVAWLHEYIRARSVAAGMPDVGVVTTAERPTRVSFAVLGLVLGGATGFASARLAAGTATAVTAIWLVFGLIGLIQLLSTVHARLRSRPAPSIRVPDPDPRRLGPSGRGAGGTLGDFPAGGQGDSPGGGDTDYPRAEDSEAVDSVWAAGGSDGDSGDGS